MEFEGSELDGRTLRGLARTFSGNFDCLIERGGATDELRSRGGSEDDPPECRVCRGEPEPGRILYAPCLCSGSIMYTHEECLLQWLRHSGKDSCELCGSLFSFIPVYSPDTPIRLPAWQVLATCTRKALLQWLPLFLRVAFVVMLWVVIVPLCTSWLYRIWVHRSRVLLPQLFLQRMTLECAWSDCISGIIISAAIILSFLSLMTFADFLADQILRDDWERAGVLDGMNIVDGLAEVVDGLAGVVDPWNADNRDVLEEPRPGEGEEEGGAREREGEREEEEGEEDKVEVEVRSGGEDAALLALEVPNRQGVRADDGNDGKDGNTDIRTDEKEGGGGEDGGEGGGEGKEGHCLRLDPLGTGGSPMSVPAGTAVGDMPRDSLDGGSSKGRCRGGGRSGAEGDDVEGEGKGEAEGMDDTQSIGNASLTPQNSFVDMTYRPPTPPRRMRNASVSSPSPPRTPRSGAQWPSASGAMGLVDDRARGDAVDLAGVVAVPRGVGDGEAGPVEGGAVGGGQGGAQAGVRAEAGAGAGAGARVGEGAGAGAGAGIPLDEEDPDEVDMEVEVHMAIDELLGIRGPVSTLLRNALWLLAFNGAYLGMFAFFPFSIGS
ncbi:unnamed protein product, partial [Discosporangium mesarthrocarpum]